MTWLHTRRRVPPAADGDGFAAQGRVEQLLDRCIEGIEVSVEDGGCCSHPDRPPEKFGSWSIVIVTIGYTAPDNAGQVDLQIFVTSREACRDRTSPPRVQWLRRPRFKQGCDHYCAMRTKCEHRVNGKLYGSEPLADFVQRFMRPTEFLKLRRGCSREVRDQPFGQ
jgi:hypothetical protein